MRRDVIYNTHKYLSNTPGGVQASASQPPGSTEMLLLIILHVECCLCIHWVVQNTKQHPFPIHHGCMSHAGVHTICVPFSFFSYGVRH